MNHVTSVLEDREENLWVGTKGGGLFRMSPQFFDSIDTSEGKAENEMQSITVGPDGSVWAGTDGAGLVRHKDGKSTFFNEKDGLTAKYIWSVLVDHEGTVWAGSDGDGLFFKRGARFAKIPTTTGFDGRSVRALYLDSDQTMWVGTADKGLFHYKDGKFINKSTSEDGTTRIKNTDVRAILRDQKGMLWVGTGGAGLSRFADNQWVTMTSTNGLPNNFINCLYEDELQNLWVGTMAGFGRVEVGNVTSISDQTKLPVKTIYQIFEDPMGNLWIGAAKGILRVRRADLLRYIEGAAETIPTVFYDERDGLKSSHCNGPFQPYGAQSEDGKLWFPTSRWISVIDPTRLEINERPPKVVIETIIVDGKELPYQDEITLPAQTESLTIYYTGLNFSAPKKTRFRYRLDPQETDWEDAGTRRLAQYENLPPGDYTFRVIAANRDNLWNETGQTMRIIIKPPFWRTWWFMGVVVGAGMLAARYMSFSELRGRLKSLVKQHALEEERARIAKDMHDDIGASLTQISLLTELLQRHPDFPDKEKAKAIQIADKARETTQKVDEIVWAVNPKNDTLDRLASYIVHLGEEFFEYSEIRCRLDIPSDVPGRPLSSDVRHNVVMVIKEALNNVQKYSEAKEVWIHMKVASQSFDIEIEDTGKGFDASKASPTGNGLHNMAKRIQEVGGRFVMDSRPSEGTKVQIHIPR